MLVETRPPAVEPPPVAERIEARSEPVSPEPEPVRESLIEHPRPKAAPAVNVGAFDATANTRVAEVARMVEPAGFDTTAARTVATKATTSVGGFGSGSGISLPRAAHGKVVADAGFGGGGGGTTGTGHGQGKVVADAGFGGGSGGTGTGRGGSGTVARGGFEFDAAQPRQTAPAARHAPTEVPPEILSKPTPVYTEEARAQRIEGEVLLDVELTAAGEVRVLRVVRGLGHGLDESAIRAAGGIRFTPAQRNGQPVDFRTTLTIVFRLA